jgi:hypothetical protein
MAAEDCSAPSCPKPGTLACTACTAPQARYCSKECQKQDWKAHKLVCHGSKKHNCFLIRASNTGDEPPIADLIEPFDLEAFGSEMAETKELKRRLGWKSVANVSKFYDHKGSDGWYYFAYGPDDNSLPLNEIASKCAGKKIHGDIAVIRSGPADSNEDEEPFAKIELVRTVKFYYTTNESPALIFTRREQSRTMRKGMQMHPGSVYVDDAEPMGVRALPNI